MSFYKEKFWNQNKFFSHQIKVEGHSQNFNRSSMIIEDSGKNFFAKKFEELASGFMDEIW